MDTARSTFLGAALGDVGVRRRYEAKVVRGPAHWWWVGAVMRSGHGRFWVGHQGGVDVVVAAHRFGYALEHGLDALLAAPVLGHECDEALCQRPECLTPMATNYDNVQDWLRRHHRVGSPLRDVRGPGGRARAIRYAAVTGGDVAAAMDAGLSDLDRMQPTLFEVLHDQDAS